MSWGGGSGEGIPKTTDQLPAAKGNPDPQDEGKEGSDADKSTQPHHREFGRGKIQNSDANSGIQKKMEKSTTWEFTPSTTPAPMPPPKI